MMLTSLGLSLLFLGTVTGVYSPSDWQPVLSQDRYEEPAAFQSTHLSAYQPSSLQHVGDQCELYKVGFRQDLYFQYVQYKTQLPEMKEFTLCFWSKFANHSNDHPIFSYAVDEQPRAILSWVANTERSSYFSLAVNGHTFYRLNYPLRLNRWYHTCQSWNGKTGEWQIWVNAERVGRGFHNRLVGHTIPTGGVAITGQEQTQLGGGFYEGKEAPRGAGGMLGEITMVQLYSVALTAGKAHRDHKHHHAHQFDHNGNQITTPAPVTPQPRTNQPTHPLLTAGQINPSLMLNFAGGQPQIPAQPQLVPGQNFNVQYINGQFISSIPTQQLMRNPQTFQSQPQQQPQLQPQLPNSFSSQSLSIGNTPIINSGLVHSGLAGQTQLETHQLFRRHNRDEGQPKTVIKRQTGDNNQKKRELFVTGGTIVDNSFISNNYEQDLLNGLAGIGQNQPIIQQQKEDYDREPAEAEVKAVMQVCSGCDEEPFDRALVFGWRTVAKKLYSGAFYAPAVQECRAF